jgi:glutamate synthase (NADPH/NADH) small chain
MIKGLNLELDKAGNVKTDNFGFGRTSVPNVYAAGDASRGQSLIVWAISYGKNLAKLVEEDLSK